MSGTTTVATMTVQAEAEREVRATFEALYAAWTANDAEAFAALYLDDATVVMPGVYNSGREQVRAYMAAAFAGPLRGSRGVDTPQSVRFLGDDAAVIVSEAGILMAGETSLPAERLHRATWLLAKRDGAWKIAAYHNCAAG
jgi:uncharacterized protein (TIGR02246 family)